MKKNRGRRREERKRERDEIKRESEGITAGRMQNRQAFTVCTCNLEFTIAITETAFGNASRHREGTHSPTATHSSRPLVSRPVVLVIVHGVGTFLFVRSWFYWSTSYRSAGILLVTDLVFQTFTFNIFLTIPNFYCISFRRRLWKIVGCRSWNFRTESCLDEKISVALIKCKLK